MDQARKDARRGKLTASCFGAALGLSPHLSRARLWKEMTGRAKPDPYLPAVKYGQEHEPIAIQDYEAETGNIVIPAEFYVHPNLDFLGASPDGLVGKSGLLEVKAPFLAQYETILAHYLCQCIGQIECLPGREWCDFYTWRPERAFLVRIHRNTDLWAAMLERLTAFWNEYILADVEPPRLTKKEKFPLAEVYAGLNQVIETAEVQRF